MRSTKLNRALSFLLVLVMILTLMPTAALAAPVGETKSSGSYDSIDAKYSVYEKVDKPAAGDTVVIYNAGNSMAVTSEILSTYYLKPLSISPNAELGVLASDSKLIAWTVSVDENGLYTFKQGDTALKMGTNQDSNGNTKFNLSGAGTATDKWHLDTCNAANGSYYMYGDGMKGKYGNVYIEYFLFKNKTTGAETPEFTTYCTSTDRLNEKAFGMTFYKLVREGVSDTPDDTGLPQVGDEVVIYNQSAKGVLALQNDSYCAKNAPTTIKDGEAVPSNGAVVFKVQKNGEYYRFYNETYGYLCSNGTGKNVRVLVFAKGDKAEAAKAAGADYVGEMDLVEKIQKENWFDFDVVVASPDMMGIVGRLGKVLGPKGLMPSPKAGTVTPNVAAAVKEIKAGKIEYRLDKTNIIHCPIGKVSFGAEKLTENLNTLLGAVVKAKPAAAKGQYIRSCVVASTMGPGVKVNTAKF